MKIYPITVPGGSDTQVQYNNGGIFGGASGLIYDDANDIVGIGVDATTPSTDGTLHVRKDQDGFTRILIENRNTGANNRGTNLRFLGPAGATMAGNWFDNHLNTYYIWAQAANSILELGANTQTRIRINADGSTERVDSDTYTINNKQLLLSENHADYTRLILQNTDAAGGTNLRFLGEGGTIVAGNFWDNAADTYTIRTELAGADMLLGSAGVNYWNLQAGGDVLHTVNNNAITGTSVDISELHHVYEQKFNNNGQAVGIGFTLSSLTNVGAAIIHERKGSQSYGDLHFATKPSGAAEAADIPINMTLDSTGSLGIGTMTPDTTLQVVGSAGFGDDAGNEFLIDSDGDSRFVGGAGLPFGSCWGNEIGWTQAGAVQNTWYEISDADMSDGQLHDVAHDGSGKLTVTYAGMYLCNYTMSGETDAGAGTHIQTTFSISGTETNDGMNHSETLGANAQIAMAGTAILDLAASATLEVSMRTTDAGAPDISVDHLNITCVQIGGT